MTVRQKPRVAKIIQAIVYARFSPRPNAKESDSAEVQADICDRYCREKGYYIVGTYMDKDAHGSSTTEEERPGLYAALAQMRRGMVLVALSDDRLARSVYLREWIRHQAKTKGWRIELVNGAFDEATPEGRMIAVIVAAVHEYNRHINAAKTRTMMRAKQRLGIRLSSRLPYGWRVDEGSEVNPKSGLRVRMIPDTVEQEVIREMAAACAQGVGLREIARWLNERKIPTRTGAEWSHRLVAKILQREVDSAGSSSGTSRNSPSSDSADSGRLAPGPNGSGPIAQTSITAPGASPQSLLAV